MDDDPDPVGNLALKLVVLFLLILVNAFFAMSEIAVISLNENKLRRMAEDGHKKAKKVLRLSENSSSFLSTIQIGVSLAGFLTSLSRVACCAAYRDKRDRVASDSFHCCRDPYNIILFAGARRACSEAHRNAAE